MAGIVGGFIAKLYGGWSMDLTSLCIVMAVDFVMGLAVAGIFKKSKKSESGALRSDVGWKGLVKKSATLAIVLVAHRLDLSIGTEYIKTTVIIGFIANETISIIENAGLMGLPMPSAITNAIEILKSKGEE